MSARTFRCASGCGARAEWPRKRCARCDAAPTLFDTKEPPTPEVARLRHQQLDVFEALCERNRRHPGGANAWEIQTWLVEHDRCQGIERNAIGSRCRELGGIGFVSVVGDRPGPSGKPEKVYAPTAAGLAWLRRKESAA